MITKFIFSFPHPLHASCESFHFEPVESEMLPNSTFRVLFSEEIRSLDSEGVQVFDTEEEAFHAFFSLGVSINNASEDAQLIQDLKGLAQAGLQNNKINYTQLIDIYTSKGIASMRRKLELAEKEAEQRENAAMESQQKQAEAMAQAEEAKFNKDLEQRERESIRTAETKLAIEEMKLGAANASDSVKNQLELSKANNENRKMDLEEKKTRDSSKNDDRKIGLERSRLDETKRSNQAKETIARQKPKTNTK